MTRITSTGLKVLARPDDIKGLDMYFEHGHAPARIYELQFPIDGILYRSAIYRRHGLFPYQGWLSTGGLDRLMVDLSRHEDGQALALSPGEFFGLRLNEWRNRHQLDVYRGLIMPHTMYLQGLAGYKIERARRAKKHDEVLRLIALYKSYRSNYRLEREMRDRALMVDAVL